MMYMRWMSDYDAFVEKHSEKNTEKAIRDLAYMWIEFNDYEKQAVKNLIKKEGKKLELEDKKLKAEIIKKEIERLEEDA